MTGPTDAEKRALRAALRGVRPTADPATVAAESRRVADQLRALPPLTQAHRIGGYLALPYEVHLDPLLGEWAASARDISVPAYDDLAQGYRMARWRPDMALRAGRHGIREPAAPDWAPVTGLQAMLVPGLAFDRQGNRLGHGEGVYDQLLERFHGWRIGVGFCFQLIDRVPVTLQDQPMHVIVTPAGAHWCAPPPALSYP